jgi:ABC-type transport system involved in multi-copper enzyme maturation permease subunit
MSATGRIWLVAWHVFKESVRDRVLYAIAAFAVILVGASTVIGQITAGEDIKIIKDLGLAVIEIAGILMAIVIGVGLVAKEIERRSIFSLLAKPLPRWQFVVGKYVGLVLTISVNVVMMAVALGLMLAYYHWQLSAEARLALVVPVVDLRIGLAIVMITAELALVTAVALFFSSFSSSTLLSILFTVGILLTGLYSEDLRDFGEIVDVSPLVGQLVGGLGWVVPAFSAFDVKAEVVHGVPLSSGFVWSTLAYALVYVCALLAGAIALFERREFV